MSKPLGKPDRIVVALGGNALGNTPEEQIEKVGHVAFAYVPFRSGSEVAVQLAGGHVAANVNNPQENMGQWRAGAIRPLPLLRPAVYAIGAVFALRGLAGFAAMSLACDFRSADLAAAVVAGAIGALCLAGGRRAFQTSRT